MITLILADIDIDDIIAISRYAITLLIQLTPLIFIIDISF